MLTAFLIKPVDYKKQKYPLSACWPEDIHSWSLGCKQVTHLGSFVLRTSFSCSSFLSFFPCSSCQGMQQQWPRPLLYSPDDSGHAAQGNILPNKWPQQLCSCCTHLNRRVLTASSSNVRSVYERSCGAIFEQWWVLSGVTAQCQKS